MIGADDDEDEPDGASQESDPYDHLDLDVLASGAEGDSVSAPRLRGQEKYFPDCRPFIQDGQQPHHLILLTTSGWAFQAEGTVYTQPSMNTNSSTHTSLSADEGGVVICFENELLVVVDGAICSIPYDRISGLISLVSYVEIHTNGAKSYLCDVAESANKEFVFAAVEYVRRRIRATGGG